MILYLTQQGRWQVCGLQKGLLRYTEKMLCDWAEVSPTGMGAVNDRRRVVESLYNCGSGGDIYTI